MYLGFIFPRTKQRRINKNLFIAWAKLMEWKFLSEDLR